MDKNEIPRSSGGASQAGAPSNSPPAIIQVTWSSAARRAPLGATPDAAPTRAALNRAVKRAVQATLRQAPLKIETGAGSTQPLEVDLSWVSDEEIAELNSSYRSKPKPTDVLSFSQCEDGELIPPMPGMDADSDAPVMLGDIVISIETAQRQAVELKHDLLTEVTFLAVHGTLHLCGYDHGTSSERRIMWKWQEQIVATLTPGAAALSEREVPAKRRKPVMA